ncbi:MAG: hypothetical protein HY519_03270 [Candidatus Aenigmarchaeota archaeon]|nr:hypothetical protein [Candidatus Aenigmarchaeota archaeon]
MGVFTLVCSMSALKGFGDYAIQVPTLLLMAFFIILLTTFYFVGEVVHIKSVINVYVKAEEAGNKMLSFLTTTSTIVPNGELLATLRAGATDDGQLAAALKLLNMNIILFDEHGKLVQGFGDRLAGYRAEIALPGGRKGEVKT